MDNDVAIVHDHPTISGKALLSPFFPMSGTHIIDGGVGKRIEHAITGSSTDNKIVCKRNNAFQVNQDDVLPLFVFK